MDCSTHPHCDLDPRQVHRLALRVCHRKRQTGGPLPALWLALVLWKQTACSTEQECVAFDQNTITRRSYRRIACLSYAWGQDPSWCASVCCVLLCAWPSGSPDQMVLRLWTTWTCSDARACSTGSCLLTTVARYCTPLEQTAVPTRTPPLSGPHVQRSHSAHSCWLRLNVTHGATCKHRGGPVASGRPRRARRPARHPRRQGPPAATAAAAARGTSSGARRARSAAAAVSAAAASAAAARLQAATAATTLPAGRVRGDGGHILCGRRAGQGSGTGEGRARAGANTRLQTSDPRRRGEASGAGRQQHTQDVALTAQHSTAGAP